MAINKEIATLEQYIEHSDKLNDAVSEAPTGWHIDHSLRVIIGVCKLLQRSDPNEYKKQFNLKWKGILVTKVFPRGKIQAPSIVNNEDEITQESLHALLQKAKELLEIIKTLPSKSHFEHQIFGTLDRDQTIKFLGLHTQHHLKIIQDIL